MAYGLCHAARFLPFVLLMALFTRLYVRHAVGRRWYAAAAVQILFLAGTFVYGTHWTLELRLPDGTSLTHTYDVKRRNG